MKYFGVVRELYSAALDKLATRSRVYKSAIYTQARQEDRHAGELADERARSAELEKEAGRMQTEISGLQHRLELQTAGVAHSKLTARGALRGFAVMARDYFELAKNAVSDGYNVLEGSRVERMKGHCVLIDRRGKIISVSPKVRRSFGYENGSRVDYQELIDASRIENEPKSQHLDFLTVNLAEGPAEIKDIDVIPITPGGIYMGSYVRFKRLGKLGKLRRRIRRGQDLTVLVSVHNALEAASEHLSGRKPGTQLT